MKKHQRKPNRIGGAVKEVKSLVLPFYCRKKKSTPVLPSVVLPF